MSGLTGLEWSWWGVVLGIVILVGNSWALLLYSGELTITHTHTHTHTFYKQIGFLHEACGWVIIYRYHQKHQHTICKRHITYDSCIVWFDVLLTTWCGCDITTIVVEPCEVGNWGKLPVRPMSATVLGSVLVLSTITSSTLRSVSIRTSAPIWEPIELSLESNDDTESAASDVAMWTGCVSVVLLTVMLTGTGYGVATAPASGTLSSSCWDEYGKKSIGRLINDIPTYILFQS